MRRRQSLGVSPVSFLNAAAKAVCDWIETRKDLEAQKIAIWGVSLGGYYAPRAAAYEKRLRACTEETQIDRWQDLALDVATLEDFRKQANL